MNSVALETSGRPASVAVSANGNLFEEVLGESHAHASDLLPALERLMVRAEITPRDVQRVFVGIGPGSYTGLRVGIATALGLIRGTGASLYTIASGETRAFAECEPGTQACLLLDARQNELYFAHYERTANDVNTLVQPCVTNANELTSLLPRDGIILGDASVAANEQVTGLDERERERVRAANEESGFARAAALLRLGSARVDAGKLEPTQHPEPLYLRPFAAKPRKTR